LSFVLLCDAARAGACARVKSKGRARTSARRGSSRTRTSRIAERRSSVRPPALSVSGAEYSSTAVTRVLRVLLHRERKCVAATQHRFARRCIAVCCLMYVACCLLSVACCKSYIACCMVHVVCCMLHVASTGVLVVRDTRPPTRVRVFEVALQR
jgi:hypothetical protein